MDLYEVIDTRRSVRSYSDKPVPKESLDRIATAIQKAPSAHNKVPVRFLLVKNRDLLDKICAVYSRNWLKTAPAILVALGNSSEAWHRLEGNSAVDIDVSIAMQTAVLAATAEGLGTCWICAFKIAQMNEALGVSEPWSSVAISPLGYPEKMPKELKRKDIDEIWKVIE